MDSDASDNFEDLYDEKDAAAHEKLVDKVLKLNKTQQLKKPSRTEPTLQISEFDLVKSITGNEGSVHLADLTKSLKNRKSRIKISENVSKATRNSQTLPKPLEKPQANRIRRTVAYEKARLQLDRWEATVTSNRASINLSFPLGNNAEIQKTEVKEFPSMYRLKSKLEEELEKHQPKVEEFHVGVDQEKFPLSMEEMLERRKEAAKLRAFQGYKEAKARRQSKIKSKKFHRIQKRERIKEQLKEFELLQKTNPEEALKKLEEIEKIRVQERFSLRHKSTGKWAKNQQIRAKYDKESRQVLAQQLTLSKDLTQKLKPNESESEEEEEVELNEQINVDENNPWVNGIKPGEEVSEFLSGYRKYWMEKNNVEKTSQNGEESDRNEKQREKGEVEDGRPNDEGNINQGSINETSGLQRKNNDIEVAAELEEQKQQVGNKKQKRRVPGNRSNHVEEDKKNNATEAEGNDRQAKKLNKKKNQKTKVNCSATSDWEVSFIQDEDQVENMFDKLENKLQKQMLSNVEKLKNQLNEKNPPQHKSEKKQEALKVDLSMPLQRKVAVVDEELIYNAESEIEQNTDLADLKKVLDSHTKKAKEAENIDPNKYINVKPTNLSTTIPDLLTAEENEEVSQREIISEAFEDDDIVDDFAQAKKSEIEKNKPKDVDLSLPGWGCWGGTNISATKRKRKRFIVKAPKKVRRRDDNKGSLIINENAQSKIREHQVSEVPFPFKSVKEFEASIRAPVGNTFVPETAFRKLIEPAVTTKMGTIIEPMSRDLLVNKKL